jgi:hypothetical protein
MPELPQRQRPLTTSSHSQTLSFLLITVNIFLSTTLFFVYVQHYWSQYMVSFAQMSCLLATRPRSDTKRRVHAWREFALQFSFCHVEKVAAQQVVDVEGLREVIAARSKVGADAVTGEGRVLVHVEGIEVERA